MRLLRPASLLFFALLTCACAGERIVSPSSSPPAPSLSLSTNTPTATLTVPAYSTPSPRPRQTPSPQATRSALFASATPAPLLTYAPWDLIHALAWSQRGNWLAVSAGQRIHIYNITSWNEEHTLDTGGWAVSLAFHPAPALFAALKDGRLQVWDLASGAQICEFNAHAKGANSLSLSPDGLTLASAGNDAVLRLWETAPLLEGDCSRLPFAEWIGGAYAVPAVAFSPDGGLLASIDLQAIRLRDPLSQRLVSTLRSKASMFCLAFSPDGSVLAAGETGNTVRLWETASGQEQGVISLPGAANAFIWNLAFKPDGKGLAAGSSDGRVGYWEMDSGKLGWTVQAHRRAVSSLAFSPEGEWLVSGGLDAKVYFWEVER